MTQASPAEAFSIHPRTRLGPVHLKVANLEGQLAFYEQLIGFQTHWREGQEAGMGAGGEDLLRMTEIEATGRLPGRSGLYHFAVLLPDQRELARAIGRLLQARYPNYPTDHIMTKTTYLDDPEGNGIELYADSPEDGDFGFADGVFYARRADGTESNGREPLDLERQFSHLKPGDRLDQPMPPGTKIGHVHLHVADLMAAFRFYQGVLGFDDMGYSTHFRMGFVSAGGYHHHIGMNTWAGEGAPPPPETAPGLRSFTIVVPSHDELLVLENRIKEAGLGADVKEEKLLLRDPAENGLRIISEKAAAQEPF